MPLSAILQLYHGDQF